MKKRMLCALCCLMACFAMIACFKKPIPKEPYGIMTPTKALFSGLDLLKPYTDQSSAAEGQTNYRVVIDDGSGMKGFVSSYCTTYSAVLTALMEVTVGGNREFVRASDLLKGAAEQTGEGEAFFNNATQGAFFRDKPNDISSVIEKMSSQYRSNANQVMILITDLMIPTADGCLQAASAIQKSFLLPEHSTIGIIGIEGEFNGTIENLPINTNTGRPRTIQNYMVLEKDTNGMFRHPLYILMMGDDQAVLAGMEKAMTRLKNCGQLDKTNPYFALFLTEYGISRYEKDDISLLFHMGHQDYNAANYPVKYIVRSVTNEAGEVEYPSSVPISEEYQQLLKKMQIVNLYTDARGKKDSNVEIQCKIPYELTDSSERGGTILDKHGLFTPAADISISDNNYAVSVGLKTLKYKENGNGQPSAEWIEPDPSFIRYEIQTIDVKTGKIVVMLSVDSSKLTLDEPLICAVGVSVCVSPRWEEIEPLYDTDWINQLTLNPKEFDQEFHLKSDSSARFTAVSTAKTPFLSSLLGGICDQQIEITCDSIRDTSSACVQTELFGVVVRNYPARYIQNANWDEKENFGGWAFSQTKAGELKSAMKNGN